MALGFAPEHGWILCRHVPDGWQKRGDKIWPWQLCSLLNYSVAIAFPYWCHLPLLKTQSHLKISQVNKDTGLLPGRAILEEKEPFPEWVSELHSDPRKHTWDDPGLAIILTGTGNNFHVWQLERTDFFTTFRNGLSAPTEMCNSSAHFSDRRKSWLNTENFWNLTLGSFYIQGCSHLVDMYKWKEKEKNCTVKRSAIEIKGYKNNNLQYYKDAMRERSSWASRNYASESQ